MSVFSRMVLRGVSSNMRINHLKNSLSVPSTCDPNVMFNRFKGSQIKIKVIKPDPADKDLNQLGYEERNERIGRVLSPHLSIYSPQLTSMLSISQRISGMALTAYVWALGIGTLLTSHDMENLFCIIEGLELNQTCLTVGKFILAIPFTFHYINAVRHLLWSFGSMLNLNMVYMSGYMALVLTPLTAIGIALL